MSLDTTRAVASNRLDTLDYNALLKEAEVTPLWNPPELSTEIIELGQEVGRLAAQSGGITLADIEILRDLGEAVVSEIPNYFRMFRKGDTDQPSFRAHNARRKGIGNCRAAHEVCYGILDKLALRKNVVAIWSIKHVDTGFATHDETLLIDGFAQEVHQNKEYLDAKEHEAWLNAVHNQKATLLSRQSAYMPDTAKVVDIDHLHELTISSGDLHKLVLPGAAATVMDCAITAGMSDDSSDHPKAKPVLWPYAPTLKLH